MATTSRTKGDRIEFDAITYNADYFHLTDIDLNFFGATLGPSFNMKRIGWDKTRFYVYGIGDEVLLGNDQYFAAGGGGVRLLSFAAERSVLDLRLETRVRQFTNSSDRPTNTLRDGAQTRFGGSYSYYLAPGLVLIVQGYSQREDAEVGLHQLGSRRLGRYRLDLRQSACRGRPLSLDSAGRSRRHSPPLRRSRPGHQRDPI
jgi:hypothetical protein